MLPLNWSQAARLLFFKLFCHKACETSEMQLFLAHLLRQAALHTGLILWDLHKWITKAVWCLSPPASPAVTHPRSDLEWGKRLLWSFLVHTQRYGAAPEQEFNKPSPNPSFRKVREVNNWYVPSQWALLCHLSSCTSRYLWEKGMYVAFLESYLPTAECNKDVNRVGT